MLDPTVLPLFESCDYAAFAKIVGKYRHDLLNRQGNVQLGCNIISRFLARLPDFPTLQADSVQRAGELAAGLVEQCRTTTEVVRDVLWFPMEEDLLEAEDEIATRFAAVRSRWQPYDGPAWETLLVTLNESVEPHLTNLETQLAELSEVLQTLITDNGEDGDVGALLATISQELDSAVAGFQLFKDLMNLDKLIYIPENNRWDSTA